MRILFISASRLGDAILGTGLLNTLIERYPGARFTIACGPVAASLYEAVPGLERIIRMRKGPWLAHWRTLLGATLTKNWFMVTGKEPRPPGKYSLPVIRVKTSAAAREKVECPLTYPANGGVTNDGRWYGHQFLAKIQPTPASSMNGTST